MAYFEDYQRKPVLTRRIEKEGDYRVVIEDIKGGKTTSNDRYLQVICRIVAEGSPHISLFLTEGENFNGNFTAFIDTFGIKDIRSTQSWIGRSGIIEILLRQKGEYINMIPKWKIGDDGFVLPEIRGQAGSENSQKPMTPEDVASAVGGEVVEVGNDTYGYIPFNE